MSGSDLHSGANATVPRRMAGFFGGLSGKLLSLTILAVMIAEVAIFVPSVANKRNTWLKEQLRVAAVASIVIDGLQHSKLPDALRDDTLMATGVKVIVLERDGTRRLIAATDMPPEVDKQYDLTEMKPLNAIRAAFDELLFGGGRVIRVFGPVDGTDMHVEVVMTDDALRDAMLVYSRNVFLLSLAISIITGFLIFLAVSRLLIRPIRRLTRSMQDFSGHPDEPGSIYQPQAGDDELAVAGQHLESMQKELQKTLRQQRNLAELGLAVSKINHDMRNILASAQLMSDRLGDLDDPMVKRLAPKLLRAIDRAVGYSNSVLAYGKSAEAAPRRRLVHLKPLVVDVSGLLGIEPESEIQFEIHIDDDLQVDADPEQLFRVIHNLCRNGMQALAGMEAEGAGASPKRISVSAHRSGSVVSIAVDDTGPGMPQKAREHLFSAFKGSVRSGGAGLGLAIAREIVLSHGGTIALVEKAQAGTLFRFDIPDRPVVMEEMKSNAGQSAAE
ncbi:sensor histidine kinase [Rhizobium sp. L1K21]|uniref:sensor histidine kinase n=1 Tax=Rhizobium sp. L1K21 TaxID=2954933 RepID=UPI00209391D3|nr:HAMP domain-containing sensor histidine kinase [Rhizobium sp. L1K21]MCO6185585.1 HAMP domain-containing histidine kinase [Rhizobium sp. L1K21]